jgi:alpha-tubulin suppressor-like RCC1 family protein
VVLSVSGGTPRGSRILAIGSDGAAYAWGPAEWSRGLGDESATERSAVPLAVALPSGVTVRQVSGSLSHAVLLTSDGDLWAWGRGTRGELGNGSTSGSPTAARVQAPPGVTFTAVSAGDSFTLAQGADGHIYSWGANDYAQLGDGTREDRTLPVRVAAPAGVTLSAPSAGYRHAVAVGSDGRSYGWGSNDFGAPLGTAAPTRYGTRVTAPVALSEPPGVTYTSAVAGLDATFATGSDGQTYAWGDNAGGVLGRGTTSEPFTPNPDPVRVLAPEGVTFTQLTPGGNHVLALGSDGHVYSWGGMGGGSGAVVLGQGTPAPSPTPGRVALPSTSPVTSLGAGFESGFATTADGNTWAWGRGANGDLGTGALDDAPTPVPLWPTIAVTEVAFGGVAGTDLVQDATGWTVTAPPGCGTADVTVTYTEFGEHTQTFPDAFAFGSAPAVTRHPTGTTLAPGVTEVTLEAAATSDDPTTVRWQLSREDGPWTDVPGATDPTLTTRLDADADLRAVFTSCAGSTATDPASIALTPAPAEPAAPDVADPSAPAVGPGADRALATTGTAVLGWVLLAAASIGLGTATLQAARRRAAQADREPS